MRVGNFSITSSSTRALSLTDGSPLLKCLRAILVPRDALPVAVALVATAVFIGWLATYLSARFAVRERVLNVLRYE